MMRRWWLLLVLGLVVVPGPLGAGKTVEGRVDWLTSYPLAQEDALITRRPILLTFTATWCGWCRKMEGKTFQDPRFVDRAGSLVTVRVDGDRERGLVALFRVTQYPTTIVLDRRGKEIGRVRGYQEPDRFLRSLDGALSRREPLRELQRAAAAAPGEAGARFEYGESLLALGQHAQAREELERVRALDPDNAQGLRDEAALEIALSYVLGGDYGKGAPALAAFLARHPEHGRRDEAMFFEGVALIGLGNRAAGLARVEEAAEITAMEYIRYQAERLRRLMAPREGEE